ncbi:YjcQ family protein [Lysinibacillus sp. CTST325]
MDKRKLIYSILKEIEQENEPKSQDYEISLEEFGTVVEMMQSDGLIKGALVQRGGRGNGVVYAFTHKAKIEMKGLTYLEENSTWAKAYKGIKEVVGFIKP